MPMLKTARTTGIAGTHRSLVSSIALIAQDAVRRVPKLARAKAEPADEDLDRLVALSKGGHNGVDLADLSREDRRKHLMGR